MCCVLVMYVGYIISQFNCFEACVLQTGHLLTGSALALQQKPALVVASFHNLSE